MSEKTLKVSTDYVLFVENVLTSDNGKLTLVNIFDKVIAKDIPAAQVPIIGAASIRVTNDDGKSEHNLEISLNGPDGNKMLEPQTQKMQSQGEDEYNINIHVNFAPMPLIKYGKYEFVVKFDGKKIGSKFLTVSKE